MNTLVGIARRSPIFTVGFVVILVFGLLAVFANWLAPLPPTQSFPYATLQPPGSDQFLLGSDGNAWTCSPASFTERATLLASRCRRAPLRP